MNPFNNLIVRFLLPYIKQFRFLFFGSAGLLIVAAMAEGGSLGALAVMASLLIDGGDFLGEKEFFWLERLGEFFLVETDSPRFFAVLLLLAIFSQGLKSISVYLSDSFMVSLKNQIQLKIESRIVNKITTMPYGEIMGFSPGELQAFLRWASHGSALIPALRRLLFNIFMMAVYIALMILVSAKLTIVGAIALLLLSGIYSIAVRKVRDYSNRLVSREITASELMFQLLSKPRLVRILTASQKVSSISLTRRAAVLNLQKKRELVEASISPATDFLILVLAASVMLFFIWGTEKFDPSDLTQVAIFLVILNRLLPTARNLNAVRINFGRSTPFLHQLIDFLESGRTKNDRESSGINGNSCSLSLKTLSVTDLTFDHKKEEKENRLLKSISFQLKWGEIVGLVGQSGSGKSTILDLLLGLRSPDGGTITIGEQALSEVDKTLWRQQIGVVDQNSGLFNMSIWDNLIFPRHFIEEDKVFEAAKLANIHKFIISLPNGYQTMCGEDGHQISAGQKQRLMLARALIRNPAFLILDEATNSLDATSENLFVQSIASLRGSKTILFVTHQLGILEIADKILFLDNGKLVAAESVSGLKKISPAFSDQLEAHNK